MMTKRRLALAATMGLMLSPPLLAQANDADAPIRAFVASFESAWNARDARALADLYQVDADQILGTSAVIVGREAIRNQWATALGGQPEGRVNTVLIGSIRHLGPDVAVVEATGNFSGGRSASGAPLRTGADRALYVLHRVSGAWTVASFHVYEAAVEPDAADAIRAARNRFAEAAMQGDARAAALVYAANGVNSVPGSRDVRGRDAIQQGFESFLAANTVESVEFTDAALDIHPFVAYETGTFVQRYHPNSGATVTQRGRYIAVWRREVGGPWEYGRFLLNWLPDGG